MEDVILNGPREHFDERERETQNIIDRICQLEQATHESRRSGGKGAGIPDSISQQHQRLSTSDTFMLDLS
jgi:hypothetical protein